MRIKKILYALTVGIINSALGAGGGIAAVYALKKNGLDQKTAQATALAVILPLTAVSVVIYLLRGDFRIEEALPFIPLGLVGAFCGTKLMKQSQNKFLRKSFALLMIFAGLRYIFPV